MVCAFMIRMTEHADDIQLVNLDEFTEDAVLKQLNIGWAELGATDVLDRFSGGNYMGIRLTRGLGMPWIHEIYEFICHTSELV